MLLFNRGEKLKSTSKAAPAPRPPSRKVLYVEASHSCCFSLLPRSQLFIGTFPTLQSHQLFCLKGKSLTHNLLKVNKTLTVLKDIRGLLKYEIAHEASKVL
jgi:hypothetical protein